MTYDLQSFSMQHMIHAGRRLRQPNAEHDCMEKAAATVVDFFYNNLRAANSPDSPPNCVLARCFKTHPYGDLPPALQQKACSLLSGYPSTHGMQCLTLLATRGERPEWNSRHTSSSHHAIPLPTVEKVAGAPMLSQLVLQLGMKIEQVVHPTPQAGNPQRSFDVFHIETALGSAMVPDQEHFVQRHGIKSVLGFGGVLPVGEFFAVILFTRVTVSPQTAALFRTLALGVKLTLLPYSGKQVFAEH